MNDLVSLLIGLMVIVIIAIAVVVPVINDQVAASSALGNGTQTVVARINGSSVTLNFGDLVTTSPVITAYNDTAIPHLNETLTITNNYTISYGTQSTNAVITWNAGSVGAEINHTSYKLANISYMYYPAAYIRNRTVVTLLNLIPLFIVLVILIGVVSLVKF